MYDLVCLAHSRWDFAFQRPQHLFSRCSKSRRVFFVEETEWTDGPAHLSCRSRGHNIEVLTPTLTRGLPAHDAERLEYSLVEKALHERSLEDYVFWFYAPMRVRLAKILNPCAVVYDCMDEPCAWKGAPGEMGARERELFSIADIVFTAGYALYEAKCPRHHNVHAFPSSVDVPHFEKARNLRGTPADQACIPGPRLGFCGVIDERVDLSLLAGVAEARPHWHLVVIGPLSKIRARDLPRSPNIHYLGPKRYSELPRYISDWDVALIPFAKNEATRYLSPTKTLEYLAAGVPVVSTSIQDVVRTYGRFGLCRIADGTDAFVTACERALSEKRSTERLRNVDAFLAASSWDDTWDGMEALMDEAVRARRVRAERYPLAVAGIDRFAWQARPESPAPMRTPE